MKTQAILFSILLFTIGIVKAQEAENNSPLTIDMIMEGEKFVGSWPRSPYWSDDNKTIYFNWNPENELISSLYKVSIEDAIPKKVSDAEKMEMPARWGDYNKDKTMKVYSKNGDLFLLRLDSLIKKQITNTVERESSPTFSGDESAVIFREGNNLFAWDIEKGNTTQLTNFKDGREKKDSKLPENKQWLENDQLSWFEILKERDDRQTLQKEQSENLKVKRPKEFYLNKRSVSNIIASPNLDFITFRLTKRANAARTNVPDFVTASGYTKDLDARPKVGSEQNTYEFWIYNVQADSIYQLSIESLPGVFDKPAYLEDYHEGDDPFEPKYESPKQVVVHGPEYSEDGKAMVVVKSLDNKDRWIALLDQQSNSLKVIDHQHDEAWIGGPGISGWNGAKGSGGWLSDNNSYWFQTEETGYSHLYVSDVESGKKKQLTKGEYEIQYAQLSKNKKNFYIVANKEGPHTKHLYKMSIDGGKLTQLTSFDGAVEPFISPNEEYIGIRASKSTEPWDLYVMNNVAGDEFLRLTNSASKEFKNYPWRQPEIIRFTAEDGSKVPAKLYKPSEENKNGAGVIFVHGAGYLQNVHKWWPSYYREQMFHNFLVDNGYTVLDIDFRASSGYGRDWRTAIYRFMGGKDLDDQIDGAKYLIEKEGIDEDRLGIYGGSYGGFITLMAMFTKPGVFKSGAALRSVTDWAHYNHGYTSNILNTPVQDSIAFYKSSPIYHAEGLEGHLLMLHGVVDTNVQFQDVVRLSQRLIELRKDNWELAVFPNEGHGFREASSWADEYRRIFKLFEQTLR